jgi:hemerythrin-like domain-containing protein
MSRLPAESDAQSKAGDPITLEAALSAGKKVPPDVTGLLMEDHRVVLGWFYWHQACTDPQTKAELVTKICDALDAHMVAEEEIVYPAAEEELDDPGLVERAYEEHRGAQDLMEKLRAGEGNETERDELMRELEAEISQHVAEEESELFPALRDSELDLYELGAAVAARRVDRLFELRGKPEARLAKKEAGPAKEKSAPSSKPKRAAKKKE